MKTFLIASTLVTALLVTAPAASAVNLVVGFMPDASAVEKQRVISLPDMQGSVAIPALNARVVDVPTTAVEAMTRTLSTKLAVRYVEQDGTAQALWVPNDPQLPSQWGLAKIQAQSAWDTALGLDVIIAIVDTGVDYNHADLSGKVIMGHDFVSGDDDPMDENDHGTHVAGIAAAKTDNAIGVAGTAPSARILAVRVLDRNGSGFLSDIASGIAYAVDNGARVINLSMGGTSGSSVLQDAVDYAANHGVVVTCAAGNNNRLTLLFPAQYDSCTSVAATDQVDARASFTSGGPGLDLSAPGVGILSSVRGGDYEMWDGTSMSAPFVAGLAALLASRGLNRSEILSTMTSTAVDLGATGYDTTFGYGRINARLALAGAGSGITPPPTPTNTAPTCTATTTAVRRDRPINLTLRCSDVDGDALTYAIVTKPLHGTLTNFKAAPGTVTYTPTRRYQGSDSFTFTARDKTTSAPATKRTLSIS